MEYITYNYKRQLNFKEKLNPLILILSFLKKIFVLFLDTFKLKVFGIKTSRIFEEAKRIIHAIQDKKASSKYSHSNIVDPALSLYEVDCSGFVNNILVTQNLEQSLVEVQCFIDSQEHIPKPPKLDPWPIHYVLFLNSPAQKKYWNSIANARLLQRGDVIAYYSSNKVDLSSESGQHIMIVADSIVPDQNPSKIWVPIFDSTKIPHGPYDLRPNGNGIGKATIGLELDSNGSPTRLQWSPESKHKLSRKIAMGRVLE